MKLAVVGGRLQGTEACYLAKKAGIQTLLIDTDAACPARGLADEFACEDITRPTRSLINAINASDMLLPTVENETALEGIRTLLPELAVPLAFDFDAYEISRSKKRSDALFHQNRINAPKYAAECDPPYIFKPSQSSGSNGVKKICSKEALALLIDSQPAGAEYVAQEYVEGPGYSIEVIGVPGNYRAYQITQIHIDTDYDCNRVTCPCALPEAVALEFTQTALTLAKLVSLHGIMDVEAILSQGAMRVLEIDARFPSQTPIAVYFSTGINFISELFYAVTGRGAPSADDGERFVSLEHISLKDGALTFPGEHIMSGRAPLSLRPGFAGADEVITDQNDGDTTLAGTFINAAKSFSALEKKRSDMLNILNRL